MKKLSLLFLSVIMMIMISACGKKEEEEAKPEYVRPDIFEGYEQSTLILKQDGSIVEIAIQDYNGSGVDYSQLKTYIEEEVKNANSTLNSDCIALTDYFDDNGVIKAAIHYTDINAYNYFNGTDYILSSYDHEKCDALVTVPEDEEEDEDKIDYAELAELSDEELAEAGFTREDVENALSEESDETASPQDAESIIATFTDAENGQVVDSTDISSEYMLFITNNEVDLEFENGDIFYTNNNVSVMSDKKTAVCSGKGWAFIVFKFNYAY